MSDVGGAFNTILKSTGAQSVQLLNGRWKMYSHIFTASGVDNETFILDGLYSDSDASKFVALSLSISI